MSCVRVRTCADGCECGYARVCGRLDHLGLARETEIGRACLRHLHLHDRVTLAQNVILGKIIAGDAEIQRRRISALATITATITTTITTTVAIPISPAATITITLAITTTLAGALARAFALAGVLPRVAGGGGLGPGHGGDVGEGHNQRGITVHSGAVCVDVCVCVCVCVCV